MKTRLQNSRRWKASDDDELNGNSIDWTKSEAFNKWEKHRDWRRWAADRNLGVSVRHWNESFELSVLSPDWKPWFKNLRPGATPGMWWISDDAFWEWSRMKWYRASICFDLWYSGSRLAMDSGGGLSVYKMGFDRDSDEECEMCKDFAWCVGQGHISRFNCR